MSKNLFSKTYEVNGRTYTDNLPTNALISITKEQYIEYEQQKEEIERLNNDIKELLKENENKEKVIKAQDNIINKAIEYIEEWQKFPHTNGSTHEELRNLKGILKGVDKE